MTEIKYDGSFQELYELGLINADYIVNNQMRYEYDIYHKEMAKRERLRQIPELITLGIIDKNGKVLDEKRLQEYRKQQWDKERAKAEAEQALARIDMEKKREQFVQNLKTLLHKCIAEKKKPRVK